MLSPMRRFMSRLLIPAMLLLQFTSPGCSKVPGPYSDPLPLDRTTGLEVGDLVEVRTLEGEHFFGELIEVTDHSFWVNSKKPWEYEGGSIPVGVAERRHYQMEELSLLRVARYEEKLTTAGTVLSFAAVLLAVGVIALFGALSNMNVSD